MISKPTITGERLVFIRGNLFEGDSEGFKVPATKTELEKVTNMVGTFLKVDSHNNEIL